MQMDIHRCRFVPYTPQSINALAFSHTSRPTLPAPSELRLALGRANGDIEIWNPQNGAWVQETVFRGSKGRTIEQLAWTQDIAVEHDEDGTKRVAHGPLRLFSTGGSTSITEWDLGAGRPKKHAEGNFGDIWCFAVQPQIEDQPEKNKVESGTGSQLIAAGCSDGTIILFTTADDDLRYLRSVVAPPVKKPKVLSITWRDRRTVVAGYEDSTIRVVDVLNRTILRNMSLGKPADGHNSVVWTVRCLPDGTILSGDSSGELKIWDAKNLSLVQRLQTHQADVLDIAASATGDMIYTFGVDRRAVGYKPVGTPGGGRTQRWAQVMHRRFHEHDVKCATSFESKEMSVLVSGGMDTRPIVAPLRRWQSEYHRTLSHLPQRPPLSSSKTSRLFISWWEREIVIYHMPKRSHVGDLTSGADAEAQFAYETLARLELKGDESIQSAQISGDGQLIVAATTACVKLFQLRKVRVGGKPSIRTRQIELPASLHRFGARHAGFSPDGRWLYAVRIDNTIVLARIIPSHDTKERPLVYDKVVKLTRPARTGDELGHYRETIHCVALNSDSRVLAVGDLSGTIDVWRLEEHQDAAVAVEDSDDSDQSDASDDSSDASSDSSDDDDPMVIIHGQKWIRNPAGPRLPQLDAAILSLSFRPTHLISNAPLTNGNIGLQATRHDLQPVSHKVPSNDVRLMAITATHNLVEFDVPTGRLSDWSRRNPASHLPQDFTKIKDRMMDCFWDCSDPRGDRLWMYGPTWLYMLDLSRDLENSAGERVGRLGKYAVMAPLENGQSKRPKSLEPEKTHSRKRKRNTGAGDQIREQERYSGIGSQIKKFSTGLNGDGEMIDVDDAVPAGSDEGEENEDILAVMRRNAGREPEVDILNKRPQENPLEQHDSDDSGGMVKLEEQPRLAEWHTFQYRSILGIAVIGDRERSDHDRNGYVGEVVDGETMAEADDYGWNNLEVAIVERPLHDVEQVPRFDGGQDWGS